jgi:membrane protein YdbS with pleckstrin-like domain
MSRAVQHATERVYEGLWGLAARWLRVPREAPALPVRAGDRMTSFRPAEGFLRYLKLWFWIVCLLIDLALAAALIGIFAADWRIGLALTPIFLVVMVLPDIVAYIAVHFRYDTTWYVMTDRSLRIRRGIWVIQETTITFENIQNVKVSQGPVERYFGISDIVVETAGAGSGGSGKHGQMAVANQGIIEGVANASEIRDLVLAKMRQSKTTGLGDEDEPGTPAGGAASARGWTAAHIAALREIRDEIGTLAAATRG